jgi:hypothetical protein
MASSRAKKRFQLCFVANPSAATSSLASAPNSAAVKIIGMVPTSASRAIVETLPGYEARAWPGVGVPRGGRSVH